MAKMVRRRHLLSPIRCPYSSDVVVDRVSVYLTHPASAAEPASGDMCSSSEVRLIPSRLRSMLETEMREPGWMMEEVSRGAIHQYLRMILNSDS
jgi:hypothetical protein